ncbi:hypothetical protein J6590_013916 [Homalodisca vitripennis]|nr:hypothetical protein J6590_013916 [Homalodisca vitripennis]
MVSLPSESGTIHLSSYRQVIDQKSNVIILNVGTYVYLWPATLQPDQGRPVLISYQQLDYTRDRADIYRTCCLAACPLPS